MSARADEIERQADNAIYSDDPDAIERLREKIAALETKRETIKAQNAAFRQSHKAELKAITSAYQRDCAMPHPAYELQNLGGNIGRLRARLKDLQDRAENGPPLRHMLTRFAGECAACGVKVDKGAVAYYRKPDLFCSIECGRVPSVASA